MVTVLAAFPIDARRVERRLSRAGYTTTVKTGGVRVSRHGRWDAIDLTAAHPADLSDLVVESAKRLLGLRPRHGISCSFDGPVGESDAWGAVVDLAMAVAAEVPLAVLDDHAGTTYLVHPGCGLVGPEKYEIARPSAGTGDLMRRLLGGS
jgi:hypothetical protein